MSLNMIFPPTSIFPDGSVNRKVLMSNTGLLVNSPEASPLTAAIKSLRICSSVIFLAEICANLRFNTVKAEASRCSAAIWMSSGPYFSSPYTSVSKRNCPSLLINAPDSPVLVEKASLPTSILEGAMLPLGLINAPICKSVTRLTSSFNLTL
ncbi:Uncharacterised protein [Neisseria meningitidis]|nr:Uncharacterised protein [Neisseria meningitidis]CWQ69580.1 Uncharacterised protein [Neisseria meningitidis]CWR61269.1 Uncharacterised protein [Neisseria meningitidis]CWS63864.1 Uncharacterised protein [Neisseria meningitidis]CWT41579.1 Uncharacterised protein [Neisseria meningitidis]